MTNRLKADHSVHGEHGGNAVFPERWFDHTGGGIDDSEKLKVLAVHAVVKQNL